MKNDDKSSHLKSCRAVFERAAQTLKIAKDKNLSHLTLALAHLTLGRAALYEAVLSSDSPASLSLEEDSKSDGLSRFARLVVAPDNEVHSLGAVSLRSSPTSYLESAMSGLRRARAQHFIPAALLTRAWLRSITGAHTGPDSAQSDLDEAWETAERGPMPLFLTDIHLYRARLFGKPKTEDQRPNEEEKYPWESAEADLKEARRLIEKHGYWRRKEELEDAEATLLGKHHP